MRHHTPSWLTCLVIGLGVWELAWAAVKLWWLP